MTLRAAARSLVCIAYALCCVGLVHAAGVVVVASDPSAGYMEVRDVLVAELERNALTRADIALFSATESRAVDAALSDRPRLVITLGGDALKHVLARDVRTPVIAALIPRAGFERIVSQAGRKPPAAVTALYLDHTLARQLDLLTLALPNAKKVGVLWGPDSIAQQRNLLTAAHARALELVSGTVGADGSLFAGLKAALDDADVMLALADPYVFNSTNISNILLTTYRARIPVVAFSPAYVKAGALLSLYTTATQIGMQAASMAKVVLQGGALPPAQYPLDYAVSVNAYVARSLDLTIDGPALVERLQRLERRP